MQEENLEKEEEYCVKIGRYIEGGCMLTICPDIIDCPYKAQEISLNDCFNHC